MMAPLSTTFFPQLLISVILCVLLLNGCNILGEDISCRELVSHYELEGLDLQRYTTKITIEFINEMTYQQGEEFLETLGFPYEGIWARTFVVETGCGNPAEQYYTNYGTDEVISLGDSSFVKYVNPVFYNREIDSDFRLRGMVGVKFEPEVEFERIEAIAHSLKLEFRDFDPGAQRNMYWLIVPKQACCNPIGIAEILNTYDEVRVAEPSWNYTIPNPTNPDLQIDKNTSTGMKN